MADWHDRYRSIIDAYRIALRELSPRACALIDEEMVRRGEAWVCDDEPPDVNAIMSPRDIASKYGFNLWDIHNWARAGNLKRYGTDNRPQYRLGDLLAYRAKK
jgi:hypothetical protein